MGRNVPGCCFLSLAWPTSSAAAAPVTPLHKICRLQRFWGKATQVCTFHGGGLQVGGRCRRRRTGRESMRNMPPCRCDFMVTVWSRGWWAFTPCVKWLAHAHECRLGPTGCQVSRCGLFGVGQGSPRLLRPRSYKFHWQDNIRTRVTGSQPFIGTLSPLANPPTGSDVPSHASAPRRAPHWQKGPQLRPGGPPGSHCQESTEQSPPSRLLHSA